MAKTLQLNLEDPILLGLDSFLVHKKNEDEVEVDTIRTDNDKAKFLFFKISEGDEIAFEELFYLYAPLFRHVIFKVTKDESIIADMLQDVFLKIWLKRDMLVTIENPKGWSLQIVYRHCFNYLKHKKVELKHKNLVNGNTININSINSIERFVYHREVDKVIKATIMKLPNQTRNIYRMNREEGLSIQQIASSLNLSVQTVKNTLSRGVKTLRIMLKEKGFLLCLVCGYLLGH